MTDSKSDLKARTLHEFARFANPQLQYVRASLGIRKNRMLDIWSLRRDSSAGMGTQGMYWGYDWGWGLPVLVLVVVAHVYVLVLASEALVRLAPNAKRKPNLPRSVAVVALTALGAATLHGLEAVVWATLYLGIGALTSVQNAMLYSLGAITS
jgi:hypothetical protein